MSEPEDTCFVCTEPFNLKDKKKVKCGNPSCEFSACKSCTRQYLLNTVNDIHCMNCKQAWDQTFVILNLNRNWFNDTYKKHRIQLLFESEKSKFPETMPHVEKYNQIADIKVKQEKNNEKIRHLQNLIAETLRENSQYDREIRVIKTGKADIERKKFIMPCQKEECKGFLSSAYKCGVCEDFCCPHCLKILGPDKNVEHTCNTEDVESATFIKNTTKSCPKCGERIHKIDGCDQMWCTICHTAFSWKTGEIQNGTVHNPHFFQYMRNLNGELPRQPGDNPCQDTTQVISYMISTVQNVLYDNTYFEFRKSDGESNQRYLAPGKIYMKLNKSDEFQCNPYKSFHNNAEIIMSCLRLFRHIQHVEIPAIQTIIDSCNNTTENRIQYIVDEISKDDFQAEIIAKDIRRKKHIDLLYIYDLIRTVGIDTIHKILDVIDRQMHLNKNEIYETIRQKSKESVLQQFQNCSDEIRQFIDYCNMQFSIIGVSHNTSSKCISLNKERVWSNFRHLKLNESANKERKDGYMILESASIRTKQKSTIKAIKEHYSKT